jgi:hypothetical protein
LENLKQAFALALPDKIYLPFAQFTYMGDYPGQCAEIPGWKADIDQIMTLYNRYHKG